jgi:hypothetical protein
VSPPSSESTFLLISINIPSGFNWGEEPGMGYYVVLLTQSDYVMEHMGGGPNMLTQRSRAEGVIPFLLVVAA